MTISGTQNTAALPAAASTANRSAALPATNGDHGTAAAPAGLPQTLAQLQSLGVNTSAAAGGGALGYGALAPELIGMPPSPYYSPMDRIQALLRDLMMAVRQLNQPGQYPPIVPPFEPPYGPYPPIEPPYGPYPPIEPPHIGCPHMDMPPIGPIDPPLPPGPPATKKAPQVGDVLGTTIGSTGIPSGDIKVKSVHGSYKSREKAVAAAKHLSNIFGNKPFGVAVSGVPGKEKYTVVGLKSDVALKASQTGSITSTVKDGWSIDTIAFSAKTAKRIQLGAPSPTQITNLKNQTIPPLPPVPTDEPVPAPVPAPHTH